MTTKMKNQKKYYLSRIEYDIPISAKDLKLADLLPDWITNLQKYFSKKQTTDDARNQANRDYSHKGKI